MRKEEAIILKLKKAEAFMSEVDLLLENQLYNTAINRLYYGCFHATRALLLTKDLVPKTHSGVSTLLHQKFVLNGLFDAARASFFGKLMQERIEDDYSDNLILNWEEVEKFIEPAKDYFSYTTSIVKDILSNK
jgi:uncharacterized protein (UPF0332 family)